MVVLSKLRIMSNNIWWTDTNSPKWAARGEDCSPQVRAVGFARVYSETKPDVIGMQESAAILTDNIMCQLKKQTEIPYALLWGRDTPIIYRADKFDLIDSDFLVYPEEVPGLEGSFNNLRTKSYCIAVLKTKEDSRIFIFATTHLWYMTDEQQAGSETARVYQLNMLMDRIDQFKARYNCPAIIVGDFNNVYSSDTVQSTIKRGYIHGYHLATDYRNENSGYHVCNPDRYEGYDDPKTFNEAIDQMLLKDMPKGAVKRFDRYCPEYYYPLSDHFPVYIDVEI